MPNGLSSAQRVRSFFATRRFRPGPWPTLAALAVVALTVSLGNWQRHRAAEKDALREQYVAASDAPEMQVTGREIDPEAIRYHTVRVRGSYDSAHQLLLDNRIVDGRPGFDVVTPLRLDDSRYVLVDRGWIAQGPTRQVLPLAPPPSGITTVSGRVNLPPRRYLELSKQANSGVLWQNLDIDRIATATGLSLAPFLIEQSARDAPADGLLRRWPEPALGSSQHLSYMMQWYSLAALSLALWLGLNWRLADESQPQRA